MSDVQILLDMGFTQERIERALAVTNNKGVEPAMEWLLAHADDDLPNEVVASPPTGTVQSASEPPETSVAREGDEPGEKAAEGDDETVAKSIKCDECGRQFRSSVEVEYHAVKSGHSSFSESTEEKKPLTEEEKKQQLVQLEDKLRKKRAEREEKEKMEALDKEKVRIRSGKDLLEARRKMEEIEMAKIVEARKREKIEEKMAKDRVRAQIAADKEARKAKMAVETGVAPSVTPPEEVAPSSSTSTVSSTPPKKYSSTKIQIRLPDGTSVVETFDAKEQLSAVRLFIQLKQGIEVPFRLMTNFPRKVFDEEDFEKPLEVLGLVPSSVVIVTK